MPTRSPARPLAIFAICFAVALAFPVLPQPNTANGKAFLWFLGVGACSATLIAFPIVWLLRVRTGWIIDGLLLAVYFLVSTQPNVDIYVHDIPFVFSIRQFVLWVWTTLTLPVVWLTIRRR